MHVYLQEMLHETHPEVSRHTQIKGSALYADQIDSDLVIEQDLMRSMKTRGGLTRGRGMTETQRLVWLMAHPVCAEVNNAMQQLTGVQYNTSEQHKDLTTARQGKDMADTCELLEFLESRNPFSDNYSLRSIATGINAGISVNVDTAKDVGEKILASMAQQKVLQHSFKKKTKLSHSVHQQSKSTMKQYRSVHNCCFKGSSQQELGMTSWKRSSNSNFAAIPQQSSKPDML